MSDVHIIKNQNDHYLSKSKEWVDGSEPNRVYKTEFKDEAINSLVEVGSKDFTLRGEIVEAEVNDKGFPIVEVLNPIPKEEKTEDDSESEESEETENSAEQSAEATNETESEDTQAEAADSEDKEEENPSSSLTA